MADLVIRYIDIIKLNPWKKNARTHSRKQIKQIADSITTFGFTNPILIDDAQNILAGHGRVSAAKLLDMEQVPCVQLSSMTEMQKRAYVVADNKLALNAGWDEDLLAQEIGDLLSSDQNFDLSLTGFTISEVDNLLEGVKPEEVGNPKDNILPVKAPIRCAAGDIWQLGPHRLYCADALDATNVDALMDGAKARMVFTDPPYNVPIDGHVCGSGAIKHREFVMASGEMSQPEFTQFLITAFENLKKSSMDGSIHFISMDWRHIAEITAAGDQVYDELKNMIVWAKDNGGMGTFYRSRHELIFAYKHGQQPHINSFELGQHGRYRTNVWEYKGINSLRPGRMDELALHPTVKPVQMIADAIKDVSARGDIVLDLFGGSGSTLIAAQKTGRRAYLMEYDPAYCDIIISRWETYAKDDAVQLFCGLKEPNLLLESAA